MLSGFILLLLLFSSSASFISVPVGSTFIITCIDDSEYDLLSTTYTWTFTPEQKGEQFMPLNDVHLNWTKSELKFSPVELRHAGQYTCVAKGLSSEGPMKVKNRFNIDVQEFTVLYKWWIVTAKEGETALLPCSPQLKAVANTTYNNARWSKGMKSFTELNPVIKNMNAGKNTENEKTAKRISWASDPAELDWSIEITDVKQEDGDWYRCLVEVGSEAKTVLVELTVETAPPPRCLNQSQPWEPCLDPDSRSWKAIVSESMTAFSAQLYNKLRRKSNTQNLLISPISVTGLLSHLLLGARGEMRGELEKALFLPTNFSCIHSEMKKMREEMTESLIMTNQMFYNPKHTLGEAFANQSLEFYDTVPEKLTNSSEDNINMINNWVMRKTQDKIKNMVESVDTSTEFILLNAVYFIGKWEGLFEEKSKNEMFMTLSGELVSVPILYSSKFRLAMTYSRNLESQVGKFLLTGKSSLYIMVPNGVSDSSLTQLEDNLNENNLRVMVKEMESVTPVYAEVTLPKIKLNLNTDLTNLLREIGLSSLFESPNLCPVFAVEEPVALTDGRHSAFLSLTEKGVEAAAASSVSFSRSFNTFSAMQPFVFIVWSDQTNCPLFMGRVTHPV